MSTIWNNKLNYKKKSSGQHSRQQRPPSSITCIEYPSTLSMSPASIEGHEQNS
ncbi:hypothetical protein BDC45DRAFT_571551 [Circinella umbellata]|nr:hypothetical protein BDC45DRAFT_571551 [Circinella umbellata]